ncbi:ABC-type Fe3+/spermidine/putrescine transport system ATPase subunit [Angulomicrobium tetraedrale]|uniref:ABC-type Fe3+/spermidine/putrescine transport system ATPase subunit n=1 Tax=Ancylobacter tetraedralis TaxID=217068 RepID=A0A839ZCY3_9HYPH|nr:ABC-type Fe3+/spermidine/putrescine transport system ATPase subunit [Ancylobacter tetraedralis]
MQPLLHLENISKRYGSVRVLDGIDITVADNEFLTILGPSGSGKTTILRIIGGFEGIDGGRLMFEGRDLASVPINRRPFNTVFQDYALFHHMNVAENVGYGLKVRGRPKAEIAAKVADVLETVGLGALGARYPAQLSGGQRQRVALARAIICEPRLILLDEPLSALDVELRAQMQRFLKSLQRRLGIAFVFITHDQEEAIALSDRIIVVHRGRIEQEGAPEQLYRRPRTPFTAAFLGENNLIPGTLTSAEGAVCQVETAAGRLQATVDGPVPSPGSPVLLAVRPEHITLTANPAPGALLAEVAEIRFLGANILIELRHPALPDTLLKVRRLADGGTTGLRIGQSLAIGWAAADAALLAAS